MTCVSRAHCSMTLFLRHVAVQNRDRKNGGVCYGPGSAAHHERARRRAQTAHGALQTRDKHLSCTSYFWTGPLVAAGFGPRCPRRHRLDGPEEVLARGLTAWAGNRCLVGIDKPPDFV